jgi:hypothetical protein
MATIGDARKWLTGIKTTLERPASFYREHVIYWRELATALARTTLQQMRPATVPADKWAEAIEHSVASIGAALIEESDLVGLRIWMLKSIDPSKPDVEPYRSIIPFETIVEWVAAGRAGEEGGKHLRLGAGEIDSGKNDRQIAWRVFHAVRLNKNPRLAEAIMKWAGGAGTPQILQAMDAVQVAWNEFFIVQSGQDWTRWVARVIREP